MPPELDTLGAQRVQSVDGLQWCRNLGLSRTRESATKSQGPADPGVGCASLWQVDHRQQTAAVQTAHALWPGRLWFRISGSRTDEVTQWVKKLGLVTKPEV